MLLLANAGHFAVISVLGDIDAVGAEALTSAFAWLDGEPVIIVSLELCNSIDAAALEILSTCSREADVQIVYVLPTAPLPRRAMQVATFVRSLHVAADVASAVRLAGSLENARLPEFEPLPLHLN
jgi:hypothetical protein